MSRDPTVTAIRSRLRTLGVETTAQELLTDALTLRRYPGLPQPYDDTESHQKLLEALKETLETLLRVRGDVEQSAITLGELEKLGLISILPNGLVTSPTVTALAGWSSSGEPNHDWLPTDKDRDQWIGDADRMPRGVAVGNPTGIPDQTGVEGVVIERTGAADGSGGVALVGYSYQPTRDAIVDPGTLANAPVEISGVPVLLMGTVGLELPSATTEDRYLLLGPTTTLADGRHVAPLILGPEYTPSFSEAQSDTRDLNVGIVPENIVTLGPLANTYTADISTFTYEVRLSAEGSQGRTVEFDVEFWVDGGFVDRDEYSLGGTAQNVYVSTPISTTISAGSTVEMRVGALETHPNAEAWVRGSVRASRLELRQG